MGGYARTVLAVVVAGVLCSGARYARADMIGPELPSVTQCSHSPWPALTRCLAGKDFKLSHETMVGAHARAVDVRSNFEHSIALYVEIAQQRWALGGLFLAPGGSEIQLLSVTAVTVGGKAGYRLEVGVVASAPIVYDHGLAIASGTLVVRHVLFCRGDNPSCTDVIAACDALVDGLGYSAFHGTVELADHEVKVVGDARLAAPACPGAQSQPLRWP